MTCACISSVLKALTSYLGFRQTNETKRYTYFVRAANDALKVLSKVTDDNLKDLPSEEEQIIFVTNHPHSTQSDRKPDIVVTIVREAARVVSLVHSCSWESISKGAPAGGKGCPLDSFRGIPLVFGIQARGQRYACARHLRGRRDKVERSDEHHWRRESR